ncbi:non-structural maintenance of chromosomes element 1 homolog [Corticium candelabrum]|uniref:non-structural maintenance of chromosomes element 1 homolog n=1 Tax=Corticium candelabrum TaxID=121492 RepID=UPI002E26D4B0|nr:non-structural maintenance of chromosomes element 1 homolog [Corticium candelabrum]
MAMKDCHRVFVQMMMEKQLVCEEVAVQSMERICEKFSADSPRGGLPSFLKVINKHLETVSMVIGRGISEDDGTVCYAFVNTHDDQYAKLAQSYDLKLIEYFKKVLDFIVNHDGVASSTDLLNAASSLEKKLKPSDANAALHQFATDGWLGFNKRAGEYSIGIRGLIELKPYLRATYDTLPVCDLCHDVVIKGAWNNHKKVHNHCNTRAATLMSQRAHPN